MASRYERSTTQLALHLVPPLYWHVSLFHAVTHYNQQKVILLLNNIISPCCCPALLLYVICHWLITFFRFSCYNRMRGGKGFPHNDCELSIYEWIPWYNTMQIQLVISLLYKQLISCLPSLMMCWQTHGVKHWGSWTTAADNLFTLLSQQSRDKGLIRSSSVEGSQQCGSGLEGGNVSCYLPSPRWEWQVIHELINKQHVAIVHTKIWNSRFRFHSLDCWFEGFGLLMHFY